MTDGWEIVDDTLERNRKTRQVRFREGPLREPLTLAPVRSRSAGLLLDMLSVERDLDNIAIVWASLRKAPLEPYEVWKAAYEGMLIAYRRCFNKAESAIEGDRRFIIKGQMYKSLSIEQRRSHKRILDEANSWAAHREPGHDIGAIEALLTATEPPMFAGLHVGAAPAIASQITMDDLGGIVDVLRSVLAPAREAQVRLVYDEVMAQHQLRPGDDHGTLTKVDAWKDHTTQQRN